MQIVVVLITFFFVISVPIILTGLYSRWISPLPGTQSLRKVPKTYLVSVAICSLLPVMLYLLIFYYGANIKNDIEWIILNLIIIASAVVAMDITYSIINRKRILSVILLSVLSAPYYLLCCMSITQVLLTIAELRNK